MASALQAPEGFCMRIGGTTVEGLIGLREAIGNRLHRQRASVVRAPPSAIRFEPCTHLLFSLKRFIYPPGQASFYCHTTWSRNVVAATEGVLL